MATRLIAIDPEIERTILNARRVVRLSHRINTELDTQLESDFDHSDLGHSDCVHSVDLSDCASDSISDSLVVFTDSSSNLANSDIMAEENHHTLKELGAPDVNYQPLCIQYPNLAANFELKSGLIHLLPKFHGLAGFFYFLPPLVCMSTRNNTNPEDLLPLDPEIERTILTARKVVSLSHKINIELDTELHSDCDHYDCVHSVDLSDSDSDSISDSLVVFADSCSNFANSDVMAERQADHATLKELGAPDVSAPLSI
ncbi:hypothetical protein K1719_041911 [Acacia pycnantha]|nr:hypothetical protein K1719_041911 [Acacia pycnantha]